MARVLIVGCGCYGRALGAELVDRGHVVRGTTRSAQRAEEIAGAGLEAVVADPDRLATLVPALEHAGVVVLLLGSLDGDGDGDGSSAAALHGPRLESLLVKLLDTTVRGVVYEACGSVDSGRLRSGGEQVARICSESRVPFALLAVARDSAGWSGAAADAVERVLGGSGDSGG